MMLLDNDPFQSVHQMQDDFYGDLAAVCVSKPSLPENLKFIISACVRKEECQHDLAQFWMFA